MISWINSVRFINWRGGVPSAVPWINMKRDVLLKVGAYLDILAACNNIFHIFAHTIINTHIGIQSVQDKSVLCAFNQF